MPTVYKIFFIILGLIRNNQLSSLFLIYKKAAAGSFLHVSYKEPLFNKEVLFYE